MAHERLRESEASSDVAETLDFNKSDIDTPQEDLPGKIEEESPVSMRKLDLHKLEVEPQQQEPETPTVTEEQSEVVMPQDDSDATMRHLRIGPAEPGDGI